jgi:hypothetical protein
MMQQPVLFSTKFGVNSLHIFMQSSYITVAWGIDCSACQDELFRYIPLMSKKMVSMLLTFLFTCLIMSTLLTLLCTCLAFSSLSEFWLFHSNTCMQFMLLSELVNHF